MAKRTAALVVAWTILLTGVADAQEGPLWPCEVTVSIEDGPWRNSARGAVRQLDAATVISWRVVGVGEPATVSIVWADLEDPVTGLATSWASETEYLKATVEVDQPDRRWVMYTLLHELGHVAGLDHNDEVSVMGGGEIPFRRFTAWDLEALSDVTCTVTAR